MSETYGATAPPGPDYALLKMAGRVAKMAGWIFWVADRRIVWADDLATLYDEERGYTPIAGEGLRYYSAVDQARMYAVIERCMTDGSQFELEAAAITARGRRIWVRTVGEAVYDVGGKLTAIQGAVQDVTERHNATEKVALLEVLLRRSLDAMTDAFFTLDAEWRFVYVNATAEHHLGRTREQLMGRVLWDEFNWAEQEKSETAYRRVVAEQITVYFEDFYVQSGRWLEVEAYPVASGIAVCFRDFTERRRTRVAILESEERFRLLAKTNDHAVWDWDVATDALWWNPCFQRVFGYPDGHAARLNRAGWAAQIHGDDRDEVLASFRRALEGTTDTWVADYRFCRHDHTFAHVHDRGFIARDANGKAVRVIGAMADLSEQRRVEAQLREQATLLDKANDAITLRDLNHRVIYWNQRAERMYGWLAAEVPTGPVHEWLYRDPIPFLRAAEATLALGEWSGELEHLTRAGGTIIVEARWTLVRDDNGLPKSILTIATDITRRKKLEAQFLRAQRMESIGALAGGIAHDLNNTLAPILMTVTAMRDDDSLESRHQDLKTIETAATRGAGMVRQLLTFVRGGEDRREIVDLRLTMAEVRSMVVDTLPKNVSFHNDVLSHWPVRANPTQMHQLLTNLCVNARDALGLGGSLKVTLERVLLDEVYAGMNVEAKVGPYVLLRVEDTGSGISRDVIDRVFEPFFTTKDVGKGTGLGLSTVHDIVHNHGGFVHVYSEVGMGSRFHVYLPADVTADVTQDAAIEQTKLPRGNGECILVVDDEEMIRNVTQRMLERFGYRVLLACHGAEAVSIYAQHRHAIDVVLTDMTMPVMDGPATIIALKSINPTIRIVGSSGLTANGNVAKAAGAGVEYFVPKPYTAEAMLRAIHDILRGPAVVTPPA